MDAEVTKLLLDEFSRLSTRFDSLEVKFDSLDVQLEKLLTFPTAPTPAASSSSATTTTPSPAAVVATFDSISVNPCSERALEQQISVEKAVASTTPARCSTPVPTPTPATTAASPASAASSTGSRGASFTSSGSEVLQADGIPALDFSIHTHGALSVPRPARRAPPRLVRLHRPRCAPPRPSWRRRPRRATRRPSRLNRRWRAPPRPPWRRRPRHAAPRPPRLHRPWRVPPRLPWRRQLRRATPRPPRLHRQPWLRRPQLATRPVCLNSTALQELVPLRLAAAQAVAAELSTAAVTCDVFPCSARVELSSPAGITPALVLAGVAFTTTAELGFFYFHNLVPALNHNMYIDHIVTNTVDSFCVGPVKCTLQVVLLDGYDGSLDDGPKLGVAVMAFTMPATFRADAVGAAGGGSLPWVAAAGLALVRCSTICLAADNNFIDVSISSLGEELLGLGTVVTFVIRGEPGFNHYRSTTRAPSPLPPPRPRASAASTPSSTRFTPFRSVPVMRLEGKPHFKWWGMLGYGCLLG